MINALASGLAGMNAMQSAVNTYSGKIAQQSSSTLAGTDPSSVVSLSGAQGSESGGDALASNMVGMDETVIMYKANANTVSAADEMLGTLLDISS